jgi:ABC-type sugar transport system, periplasmic component
MKKRFGIMVLALMLFVGGIAFAEENEQVLAKNQTIILEDDAYSYGMAAIDGELYYIQSDDCVIKIDRQGKKSVLTNVENLYGLATDGEKLYNFDTENAILYGISEQGVTKLLQIDEPGEYVEAWAVYDGCLVIYFGNQIQTIDIATGETTLIKAEGIRDFAAYKPGQYVALTDKRVGFKRVITLSIIDAETGAQTELAEIGEGAYYSSIAYEKETDTFVFADSTAIYTYTEAAGLRLAAHIARGDIAGLSFINKDYAAIVADGDVISIRNISADAEKQKAVSISQPFGRAADFKAFLRAYGDVNLNFVAPEKETVEEQFIQDMAISAGSTDIYLLSDLNLLTALKEKGYAVDLSKNETIKNKVGEMYTPFKAAYSYGEGIYALPESVFFSMPSYNKRAFEELGLKMPTTYEELFDLGLEWVNGLYEQYPEYWMDVASEFEFGWLLKNYADEMSRNGLPLTYDNETLKRTLEKYLALYRAEKPQKSDDAVYLIYSMIVPNKGILEYLPLVFEKGNESVVDVLPGDFKYFVVNPYSKNIEMATAFLETHIANMDNFYRVLLFETITEAVPNEKFAQQEKELLEEISALETRLANAAEEDKRTVQDELTYAQERLENLIDYEQWRISQADIDSYKECAGNVYFNPFNPILSLTEDYDNLFEEYEENPQFNLDRFLKDLDGKIKTINREFGK